MVGSFTNLALAINKTYFHNLNTFICFDFYHESSCIRYFNHFYTRINKNSFYEDKNWNVFESKENEDHLLLTRIGFPTEEDLPEYVFVQHVYIDKFNDLKFKKYGFDNFEVDELITGGCKFDVLEDPLLTQ